MKCDVIDFCSQGWIFGRTDEKTEFETENRVVEEPGTESRALGPGSRDAKSAGASQGLMDRKDVLAGMRKFLVMANNCSSPCGSPVPRFLR